MFDPINGDNPLASELSITRVQQAEAETEKSEKSQFLELLVAQMENQNPLEPQDGTEFLSQLAQLSTVDGIERLNESMESMSTGFRSGQALQATALVGRSVAVAGDRASLDTTGPLSGGVELDMPMTNVRLHIKDAAGQTIRELSLGTQESGVINFSWDGLNSSGERAPAGEYRIEATGVNDGETQQLNTRVGMNVDSVTLGPQSEVTLNLSNGQSVSLSEVSQIN